MLKRTFEDEPIYLCEEDSARRTGERTERGLFLATLNHELHKHAIAAFKQFS
jgi:hypothetical protein